MTDTRLDRRRFVIGSAAVFVGIAGCTDEPGDEPGIDAEAGSEPNGGETKPSDEETEPNEEEASEDVEGQNDPAPEGSEVTGDDPPRRGGRKRGRRG